MKKVLLTNVYLKNLTGSELDTIEIASYFLKNNWNVDVFTFAVDYPLKEILDKKIKVITPSNIEELSGEYDLIWAHHFPLLDYLLFCKKVKSKRINYVSLSPFEPYECLPEYSEDLTMVSCNSLETMEQIHKEGYDFELNLFPNYVQDGIFERKHVINDSLKKIAIVSNHVPNELLDFKNIAQKNNISVEIYGMGYNYVPISEKILNDYDLIISIGRTINLGLSLGIPCYCYDRFGGVGYITKENIEKAFYYNFSGRGYEIKKSGQEIFDELVLNYNLSLNNVEYNNSFAKNNFCFENNMDRTLSKIFNLKEIDYDLLYKNYSYLFRKSELFVREINNFNNQLLFNYDRGINVAKLYSLVDGKYTETNCKISNYNKIGENRYSIDFSNLTSSCNFRFDPFEIDSYIIEQIEIIDAKIIDYDKESIVMFENKFIIVGNGSKIYIETNKTDNIKIELEIKKMSDHEVKKYISSNFNGCLNQKELLLNQVCDLESKIYEKTVEAKNANNRFYNILNSKRFKFINKALKLINK